jgi:cell division protein FtsI (penicillin-binding protein 3)
MKPDSKRALRRRVTLVGVGFALLLTIIAGRVIYLQVFCENRLARAAADQVQRNVTSTGKRGNIYDRHHREMATSIEAVSVAANPSKILDRPATARKLAQLLDLDPGELTRRLVAGRAFVWVKRLVTPKETEALNALNLPGIEFQAEPSRFYPNKTLAAQVLGFTGIDGHGLEGLEFAYDADLRGAERKRTFLADALGRRFETESGNTASDNGHNLILTLDRNIQFITERALAEAVDTFGAKSGMAIVMAPKTGDILAMANVPLFNPNRYASFDPSLWRNRTVTDAFEPGSTLKIFSAAAAIESGVCSPNTLFFCENGAYRIGGHVVHDTHPHGWLSLQQVVQVSSNIGAIKIGETIGPEALGTTLNRFGFGKKTGLEALPETSGELTPYRSWAPIHAGTIAFGQGISVSALQLVTAVAAIANHGLLMTPRLVETITDAKGRVIRNMAPRPVRQAVSPATAATITGILETVIAQGGTGTHAAVQGYLVCGKTGTAQKVSPGSGYAPGKYISSFVGFAPANDPAIVILVVLNEPKTSHYGGTVAAPAFQRIARETLTYLNIPPTAAGNRLTVSRGGEASG